MYLEMVIGMLIVAAVGMVVTGAAADDPAPARQVDGDEYDNGGNNCA